jgi:tRNA A-37 threonylcarbamoyl transferase component Bud32/dipeptidyl aminopeptidase/acylaminoacyl peptidase
MPILSGARFGSFEVLERLGAGGMGEVYRARDLRLDRTVALKVIRAADQHRRDRLERFKREARAISRFNHPHICALYDIGEQDGEAFLVMEYVAGETLTDRLARGPLRLEDALRYGVQIADALDMAHRNGVVHRDLKPSNIMIGRDGVKLLDFGLAKLREVDSEAVDQTTASLGLSEEGLVIGSLPYMAPEQVEGRRADARCDVFALGVVLYEMVTGALPFKGDSKASLIVSILSEEPQSPTVRQPLMPALFDRVIRRCLAKSADDRWQTAADLKAELQYIVETLHDVSATATTPMLVPSRRRRGAMVAFGTALGVTSAVTAIAVLALARGHGDPPSFERLTYRRGIITGARIAPDGQTILYSASWEGQPYDLYLTRLGSHESRSLGIPDARLFSISSANEIAFTRGQQSVSRASGTLARVPLAGGTPRELLENVAAADWSPDASELAVVRTVADGKVQVEFPIGHKIYESSTALASVRVSPDGDRVAFWEGETQRSLVIVDRTGRKSVVSAGWSPALGLAWAPGGRELWITAGRRALPALRAVSLNGEERVVAQAPDALRIHDVLSDGRVLALRDYGREGFACRAPDESRERDLSWFDGSSLEAISADGRTALFGEIRGGGGPQRGVYLRKTDGASAVRLADGYPEDLSPDGRWVLARSNTQPTTWVLLPVGAGIPRPLPRGNVDGHFEANFLPNGQGIVFGGSEAGKDRRIYIQDLNGGLPRAISPEGFRTFAVTSPDSRFVVGSSSGRYVLFPIDGRDPQPLPFLSVQDSPLQWTRDGRFLYVVNAAPWSDTTSEIYQTLEARIDKVDVVTGARTTWVTLKPADSVGLEAINQIVITPDGTAYCYGFLQTFSDLVVISGLK